MLKPVTKNPAYFKKTVHSGNAKQIMHSVTVDTGYLGFKGHYTKFVI